MAERARQIGDEIYPIVVALLADDSSKIPRQFDIDFKKNLAGYFGQTVGTTINLRAEWFARNPTDLDETLQAELGYVNGQPPRDIGRRLTVYLL